mmetsp:Transcript_91122/g.262794  ORF Transcript_91122/g.262794 Transcript_91122/m.262794 type:complete len:360 (-) Transcript_91122:25-1104(-)
MGSSYASAWRRCLAGGSASTKPQALEIELSSAARDCDASAAGVAHLVSSCSSSSSSSPRPKGVVPWRRLGCCCTCIPSGSVAVLRKSGRYEGSRGPGLACCLPPWQEIGVISLAAKQLDVSACAETADGVRLTACTAVLYRADEAMIGSVAIDTGSFESHIVVAVEGAVRAAVQSSDLQTACSRHGMDALQTEVTSSVTALLQPRGCTILRCFVTSVAPEEPVLRAWTEAAVSRMMRDVASEEAVAREALRGQKAEAVGMSRRLASVAQESVRSVMARSFEDASEIISSAGFSSKDAARLVAALFASEGLNTDRAFLGQGVVAQPDAPGVSSEVEEVLMASLRSVASLASPAQELMAHG